MVLYRRSNNLQLNVLTRMAGPHVTKVIERKSFCGRLRTDLRLDTKISYDGEEIRIHNHHPITYPENQRTFLMKTNLCLFVI